MTKRTRQPYQSVLSMVFAGSTNFSATRMEMVIIRAVNPDFNRIGSVDFRAILARARSADGDQLRSNWRL